MSDVLKAEKTQEEVSGMETVKHMAILGPLLLPETNSKVQLTQEHPRPGPAEEQSLPSPTSTKVPNTGLHTAGTQ